MNAQFLAKYRSLLEECRQTTNQINLDNDEGYLVRLAIFSANLTNFLPAIPYTQHQALFKESICNTAYENFDWNILGISDLTAIYDRNSTLSSKTKQFIFCSFHLGSYRVIANYLFKNSYDFSILVRGEVFERQAEDLIECSRRVGEKYGVKADFRIHNAENPDVLLKVLRELKEGRSLLVFVDGNTGSGNSTEKLDAISFLGQDIQVRKGVGYISHLSNVPILPVISYRKANLQNVLEAKDIIYPDKTLSRDHYSQHVNQRLYDLLAQYLVKYPEQWEGWNYVQQFLAQNQIIENTVTETPKAHNKSIYRFNYSRYCLINLQKAPILFDKKNYTTFEISVDLHEYLSNKTYPNPKHTLGARVFNQLLQEQVMIY
jgi:lauroyl/myristoyl acyltransferase